MALNLSPKHLLLGLVAVSLFCVILLGGFLLYVGLSDRQMAYYPGSAFLSSDDQFKLFPNFYYEQGTVYVTSDAFPTVFRWYSNEFGLGPDVQGQSNCASVSSSDITLHIKRVMTVTLCDTPAGRMIFTERAWWWVSR